MSWIQAKASIRPDQAEPMEEGLTAAGAIAITLEDAKDQPVFEPERGTTPLWEQTILTALFPADQNMLQVETITKRVFQSLSSTTFPGYRVEILENQDWTRKWIENFKPIQFGKRLWICPSWCDVPSPDAVNLILDPGLAFGTGTHPTTSLCLKWLDQNDVQGKSVIDFGCGSGILGIAALLLGAASVVAVDNDPQALLATTDNALRNQIENNALKTFLPEDAPQHAADVVIANILAQPLHQLKEAIAALTKPGGHIVLSGILENQAAALANHYRDQFSMNPPDLEDGWVRLTGIKKAINCPSEDSGKLKDAAT